jgi:hypothetical protein
MRRLFLVLGMTLFALAGQAAEPMSLKPGEVLRGRFVQERFLKGFDRPVRSEGTFVLAPGRGLIWRGETPFPVVTAITSGGIVQSVDGQETMRLSAAKIPFLARLYDMMGGAMAGDWKALENDFVVSRREQGKESLVTLSPKRGESGAQPFRELTARVGQFVEQVEVIKADGDHDRLTFRDQGVTAAPLASEETAILEAAAR